MNPAAGRLLESLLAARNAGSRERVRALVAPDATYWDCLGGSVRGADVVTASLIASHGGIVRPRFDVETLATSEGHAVVELRVCDGDERDAPGYPATEVYELRSGLVAACRSYLDPADVERV